MIRYSGVLRVLVGLLLLITGSLKAYGLLQQPPALREWWVIGQVQAEWLLGIMLLLSLYPRATWLATMLTFVVFAAVAGWQTYRGQTSCGCFGALQVKPWQSLMLDLSVLAGLAFAYRPPKPRPLGTRPGLLVPSVAAAAVAATLLLRMGPTVAPTMSPPRQMLQVDFSQRRLSPPLDLLQGIDIGPQLSRGNWEMLLYHYDCAQCLVEIDRFLHTSPPPGTRRAIVAVPPVGNTGREAGLTSRGILQGRLSAPPAVPIQTPVVMTLVNGQVWRVEGADPSRELASLDSWTNRKPAVTPVKLTATPQPAPQSEVRIDEFIHDIGFVMPGTTTRSRAVLRNPLPGAVGIRQVVSECGCVKVADEVTSLAAGEEREVGIIFEAPATSTLYTKKVRFQTDSQVVTDLVMTLRANVGLPLVVPSGTIEIGPVSPGQQVRRAVEIRNLSAEPIRVLYATSDDPACVARVPRQAIAAGAAASLDVSVQATEMAGRRMKASITLYTDSTLQPNVAISVVYEPRADVAPLTDTMSEPR